MIAGKHKDHQHVLKYKQIKIGDYTELTDKPHRIIYDEFGPGVHGVWYEECSI